MILGSPGSAPSLLMIGTRVSPNFSNCSSDSHTSNTSICPSTSTAQWNVRPGTLPKPAPASSSLLTASSYVAVENPFGLKWKASAMGLLWSKDEVRDWNTRRGSTTRPTPWSPAEVLDEPRRNVPTDPCDQASFPNTGPRELPRA